MVGAGAGRMIERSFGHRGAELVGSLPGVDAACVSSAPAQRTCRRRPQRRDPSQDRSTCLTAGLPMIVRLTVRPGADSRGSSVVLVLAAVAGALVLALSGCSRPAGTRVAVAQTRSASVAR